MYAKQTPNQNYAKAYLESAQEESSTKDSIKKQEQHNFQSLSNKIRFFMS